jgi:hypothetical protein
MGLGLSGKAVLISTGGKPVTRFACYVSITGMKTSVFSLESFSLHPFACTVIKKVKVANE